MNDLVGHLEERLKLTGCEIISYDELVDYPAEQVEEAKRQGRLRQVDDADGILCDQCPEPCWKDVDIREDRQTGKLVGTYFCDDEDHPGMITIDVKRLELYEVVAANPKKKRKTTRKPKTKGEKVVSSFRVWDKDGNACFVVHNKAIEFYYNRELKKIPFQEGAQAPRVLLAFLDNTRSGEEIKGLADAEGAPYQTVRNINRTINTHLRKVGFKDIDGIGFIHLDKGTNRYVLTPNIVEYSIFQTGLAALK